MVVSFTSSRNPGISSFLEWWESEGLKKSIILPEQQDSIKVLTIHKSKGLEFRVVILPFVSWNLDHKTSHNNILWAKPDRPPFNSLGIVPVRYQSDLKETIFAGQFFEERYAAYLDNINLLYVAFTRAVNVIVAFAPAQPRSDNRIAAVLRDAICFEGDIPGNKDIFLHTYFNRQSGIFEFGSAPKSTTAKYFKEGVTIKNYQVNDISGKLKLKLHWENYFVADKSGIRARVSHGRIMHEIFSEIITSDDVSAAVRRKVIEGLISQDEGEEIMERINILMENPVVRGWFEEFDDVFSEKSILMPDSLTRRPDRVVLKDGKVMIIDFKFGEENQQNISQVSKYKSLLESMGYENIEAYLWYFELGKIVTV
jgi:ATP-dependent exoDNAse (exonuclease V) beta subunit